MKKRFISAFLITVAVILLSAMTVTILIDPLFQYHKPWFGLKPVITNERYQNAGIARNFDFDNAVIGNSLAENFYVSDLNMALGGETVKLTASGSSPFEWQYNLSILSKRSTVPQKIIFNLDCVTLLTPTDRLEYDNFPIYLYDDNKMNDVNYLLNLEIFYNYSFNSVWKNHDNSIPDYDSFQIWDETRTQKKEHRFLTIHLILMKLLNTLSSI